MASARRVVARKVRLFLVRHGESLANTVKGVVNGRCSHTTLSKLGEKQARLLGRRLADERLFSHVDAIHVSPAVRTRRTFELLIQEASKDITMSPDRKALIVPANSFRPDDLLELDQGDYTGRLREEVYTEEVVASIRENQWEFKFPNGESQRDVEERMVRYLYNNVMSPYDPVRHAESTLREGSSIDDPQYVRFVDEAVVLIVGHAIAFKCFLRFVLNSDPYMSRFIHLDNSGICELSYKYAEKQWAIWKVNDSSHLGTDIVRT